MPPLRVLLAAVGFLAACSATPATVIIDGREVPRITQEFAGQPYTVRHSRAHPQPGGPSGGLRSPGGSITGLVCGADVQYEVEHRGDHVQLIGFVDSGIGADARVDAQIRVTDRQGQRFIVGQIGTLAVDLRLRPNELVGWAGAHGVAVDGFQLKQVGDDLIGTLRLRRNEGQTINIKLTGRDALWAMTPAAQAAVVPLVLVCLQWHPGFLLGNDPEVMGFGGKAGAMPRGTLKLRPYQ
jgi:hypothetical protein